MTSRLAGSHGTGSLRERWLSSAAAVVLALTGAAAAAQAPAAATVSPVSPSVGMAEEVPFITTPDNVTLEMLRLARVAPGDHVIDLGSGDGRIVITAARRFGASGLGVEIDPALVKRSQANAERAGVAAKVEFREQDLFKTDLARASVITMYLLPEFNLRLRPALLQLAPGTRLVSHDWDMGDWIPDRTVVVDAPDKPVGREKVSRLHLWTVPARLEGTWCGPQGATLRLAQRYQTLEGTGSAARRSWALQGRIEGRQWRALLAGAGQLAGRLDGDALVVTTARGPLAAWAGQRFSAAVGSAC